MKPKTNISIEHRAISETYKYQKKQEAAVSDIADMVQTLYQLLDDNTKVDALKVKQFGAVLMDIRESLNTIKKKDVEFPDFAKPIVEAVSKLEKTLGKVEFKPEIKVDAPQVNVDSPSVDVDLKGVEKLLKNEIPKAFKEAIALIPQTEIPEQADRWDEVLEALAGVEIAARLKPQMPTTLKVTNPDGSSIGSLSGSTYYENRNDTTTDTNLVYLGKALPGSDITDAAWQIKRYNKSTGHMSFADDVTAFTKVWNNRASYTY